MDFFVRRDYQRVIIYIISSIVILYVFKYMLPYFLPLVVAWLIVIPLQKFCEKKHIVQKNGKGVIAGGVLFGIFLIMAILLLVLGAFLVSKVRDVLEEADFVLDSINRMKDNICWHLENFLGMKKGIINTWIMERMDSITSSITDTGNGLISGSVRYIAVIGRTITFFLVSFICVILFAREVEGWKQGLIKLSTYEPAIDRILSIILRIGKKIGIMIKAYIKTQTIVFLCISTVAALGLCLLGVNDGIFYGILAGFMDFLPFIGTGIVLMPIGIINIISGNIFKGILVLAIYLICILIREFLEPKILGNGLKFSPVAILIAVYAGVMFYGIGGVILGPVTLMVLVEFGKELFSYKD